MNISEQIKLDNFRKAAKARGAQELFDGQGSGFDSWDEEGMSPAHYDERLMKEIAELEDRARSLQPPAEHLEMAAAQYESNCENERVRAAKWLYQAEDGITSFVAGRYIRHDKFLTMLQRIRPDAEYNQHVILGRIGVNIFDRLLQRMCFVTTVQFGQMCEWSQMRTDKHGIPTNEKYRGWRTPLMVFIEKKLVTEEEVHKVFGRPIGPRAARWNRMLFCIRNSRCPECMKKVCICKNRYESLRADKHAYKA